LFTKCAASKANKQLPLAQASVEERQLKSAAAVRDELFKGGRGLIFIFPIFLIFPIVLEAFPYIQTQSLSILVLKTYFFDTILREGQDRCKILLEDLFSGRTLLHGVSK
jgi:hypothetical protein